MNDLSSEVVNKCPQSTPIRKIGAMNKKSITGDKKTPIIQKRPALNARSVKEHRHNDASIQCSLEVSGGQLNVTSTHFYDQEIYIDLAQIKGISFSKGLANPASMDSNTKPSTIFFRGFAFAIILGSVDDLTDGIFRYYALFPPEERLLVLALAILLVPLALFLTHAFLISRKIKINFRGGFSRTYTLPKFTGSSEEAEAFVQSVRQVSKLRRQEEKKVKQSEIENAEKQEIETEQCETRDK